MERALGTMTLDDFLAYFFAQMREMREAVVSGKVTLGGGFNTAGQVKTFLDRVLGARIFFSETKRESSTPSRRSRMTSSR